MLYPFNISPKPSLPALASGPSCDLMISYAGRIIFSKLKEYLLGDQKISITCIASFIHT